MRRQVKILIADDKIKFETICSRKNAPAIHEKWRKWNIIIFVNESRWNIIEIWCLERVTAIQCLHDLTWNTHNLEDRSKLM